MSDDARPLRYRPSRNSAGHSAPLPRPWAKNLRTPCEMGDGRTAIDASARDPETPAHRRGLVWKARSSACEVGCSPVLPLGETRTRSAAGLSRTLTAPDIGPAAARPRRAASDRQPGRRTPAIARGCPGGGRGALRDPSDPLRDLSLAEASRASTRRGVGR